MLHASCWRIVIDKSSNSHREVIEPLAGPCQRTMVISLTMLSQIVVVPEMYPESMGHEES